MTIDSGTNDLDFLKYQFSTPCSQVGVYKISLNRWCYCIRMNSDDKVRLHQRFWTEPVSDYHCYWLLPLKSCVVKALDLGY